jgi:hypothetical protein
VVSAYLWELVSLQTFFDYLKGEEGLAEFINNFSYLDKQVIKVLDNLAKMIIYREQGLFA